MTTDFWLLSTICAVELKRDRKEGEEDEMELLLKRGRR
jgi:hypothetical protein